MVIDISVSNVITNIVIFLFMIKIIVSILIALVTKKEKKSVFHANQRKVKSGELIISTNRLLSS